MSAEPEGVQDLLEQDATMWEGEGDDNAPQEGEGEAPGKGSTAEPMQESEGGTALASANGKPGATGKRHLPIPVPPKAASFTAGTQNGTAVVAKPPPAAGARPAGAAANAEGGSGGRVPPRYFILKSRSMFNVEQSVEKGVWATQKHNEEKLNEAFRQKCGVFLIFSVTMTGHFQGYARMMSYVSRDQVSNIWEGGQTFGGSFRVEWKRRYDLPFEATSAMPNPLNEGKPVNFCRDGQELPPELGRALTRLIDQRAEAAGVKPPPRAPGGPGGPQPGGFNKGMQGGFGPGHFGPRPPMAGGGPFPPMVHPMGMDMMGGPPMMMMGGGGPMMGMGGGGPMMGGGFPGAMGGHRPPFMMNGGGMDGGGFDGGFAGGPGMLPRRRPEGGGMGGWPAQQGPPEEDAPGAMGNGQRRVSAVGAGPAGIRVGFAGRQASRGSGDDYEEEEEEQGWEGGGGRGYGGRGYGDAPYGHSRHGRDEGDRGRSSPRRRSRGRRSRSPRHDRGRRRSRSRSRSRSHERRGLADMSYEQYLEAFEKLQKKAREAGDAGGGGAASPAGMNPVAAMMGGPMLMGGGGMNPAMVMMGQGGMGAMGRASQGGMVLPGVGGMMMPGMGGMGNGMMGGPGGFGGSMGPGGRSGGDGQAQISEEDYVQVWRNYSRMTGSPFDPVVVRGWYQQYRRTLGR